MKFYKRDPDAALAGMAELTLQERGAYNSIIDLLYSRDGALPNDDTMIRRVLGCHGHEWRAVKAKLIAKGKIWIEGGYLKAKRVESVLKEASNFSQTQRKRATNRWETERKLRAKSEKDEQNQQLDNATAKMPYTPTPISTPSKKQEEETSNHKTALPEKTRKTRKQIPSECPTSDEQGDAMQFWGVHARFDLTDTLDDQIAQFRDHHISRASTMANWSAAWRTWYRNALKFNKRMIEKGLSAHDKGTLGAAMFIAEAEARESARSGNGAGKIGHSVPKNGHGRAEVENSIRDVLRGHETHDPRTGTLRLQPVPQKPGK